MQKRTRSILDELASMSSHHDQSSIIESRASNVIAGAVNLVNYLREQYSEEVAAELERRLLNSIRSQDPQKFTRGIRRLRRNESE